MPEQISKYPDVTLKVLKEAGAVCGEGAPQKILTACPKERFCSLPTGEVCIYGISEIPKMTQISPQEVAKVVCPAKPGTASGLDGVSLTDGFALGGLFVAGIVVGRLWRRRPAAK